MTLQRIVFLDIDGVLTHEASNYHLDSACLARLDDLLVATRAELILTSSWRDTYGINETQSRLARAGLRCRLAGAVPACPWGSRTDEIETYLHSSAPEAFVILDDVLVEPRLRSHLVLTDDFVGLTDADVTLARRLLL